MKLGMKTRAVLRDIAFHLTHYGDPPTVEHLARLYDISHGAVRDHLGRLTEAGHLGRDEGGRLELLVPGRRVVPVRRCEWHDQQMPADHECPGGAG